LNQIILGITAFFIVWALLIFWNFFGIRREAQAVYRAARNRGEFPDTEPFGPFERAYLKTSVLRVSIYRWLASLVAVVSLPFVVAAFNWLWVRAYYLFQADDVFGEGQLIHSFYLAVGSLSGLVFVAGVFAWYYHKGRPADFDLAWEAEKQKQHGPDFAPSELKKDA
tara:strand:+ start:15999 stop:16499 length:501 start_codon:yes stop_codon:yes gene_type:complete